MSVKHKENKSINIDTVFTLKGHDEKSKVPLKELFEGGSILGTIKEESLLKKRIELLNSKFYQETDKYLANKLDMERSYEVLFCLLFKQIGLYIEEIDHLNSIVNKKCDGEVEHKKDKAIDNNIILKNSLINLEKKLMDKTVLEERMKNEINSLKRQVKFYKEKLQLELVTNRKTDLSYRIISKKPPRKFSDKSKNLSNNNLVLEQKNNFDLLIENNTSNLKSDLYEQIKISNMNDNISDKMQTKPDENIYSNNNLSFEKITTENSNDKHINQIADILTVTDNKRINRDKVKSNYFSPKMNKSHSKSPIKRLLAKDFKSNKNGNVHNNSHHEKNKTNLNKNDLKNHHEKIHSSNHQKPDVPQSLKNKINKNSKIREIINPTKVNKISPKTLNTDSKDKEIINFIENVSSKFDDELLILTELENVLINAKLDLKSNNIIVKDNRNQEILSSIASEDRINLSSLESHSNYLLTPHGRSPKKQNNHYID